MNRVKTAEDTHQDMWGLYNLAFMIISMRHKLQGMLGSTDQL